MLISMVSAKEVPHKENVAADSTLSKVQNIWWAPDKGRHLVGSMISTVFLAKLNQQMFSLDKDASRAWAVSITFTLGVGKEVIDAQSPSNRFSWPDLVANIAGIALGIVLLEVN
jgi:uncharacterized protein YfiM (DUF2279 family)